MAVSVRITRTLGAIALSAALIGGALVVTNPNFSLSALRTSIASAASTASVLNAFAQKDSDADGLPDWQEALYGTDPKNAHSVSPTLTDGEAVAQGLVTPKDPSGVTASSSENLEDSIPGQLPAEGSLTEAFSHDFYTQVVQASDGGQLSDADQQTIVTSLLSNYSQKAQALFVSNYTQLDVHTSNTVTVSMYAAAVEKLALANAPAAGATSPYELTEDWILHNNPTAKTNLVLLSKDYAAVAQGLASMSVPPQFVASHLQLMQAFDSISRATNGVTMYDTDPLVTLGALGMLTPESKALADGLTATANSIIQAGEPAPGEPGALLVQQARALKGL